MKKGQVTDNIIRAATRWKELGKFNREKAALVLSPHLDDIFLSLYATIVSGKLCSNIIGVNFYTSSDSTVATNTKTDFTTVVRVSTMRMQEELNFSRFLLSRGINYLPVFLGLKDASIEKYYHFIAAGLAGKLPSASGISSGALKLHGKLAEKYASELRIKSLLGPLLADFKSQIKHVLAPMAIGTHLNHTVLGRAAMEFSGVGSFGLYAEIPYVYTSGSMSVDKLRSKVPEGFEETMVTDFNADEKAGLFKKFYKSQYEKRTCDAISAASSLGEVIFWKNK